MAAALATSATSSQAIKFGDLDASNPTETIKDQTGSPSNKESSARAMLGMRDRSMAAGIRSKVPSPHMQAQEPAGDHPRKTNSPAPVTHDKDVGSPSNRSLQKNEGIVSALKKRIGKLAEEVESRKGMEVFLRREITNLHDHAHRLEVVMTSLEFQKNALSANLSEAQGRLASTFMGQHEVNNLMTAHEYNRASLIHSFALENTTQLSNLAFLHHRFSEAHVAFTSAHNALQDLQNAHRNLISEKSQLEIDVETFSKLGKKDIQKKDVKIEQLSSKISTISKHLESSQLTIEEMTRDVEIFGKEIDRLDTIISEMSESHETDLDIFARLSKKDTQEKDKKIEHLESRISAVSADLESALQDGQDLRSLISESKSTEKSKVAEIASLKDTISQLNKEKAALEKKVDFLVPQLRKNGEEISDLRKKLDESGKHFDSLVARKKEVDYNLQVGKEAYEKILSDLQDSMIKSVMESNNEIKELQSENESLRAELGAAQEKLGQSSGPSPS